jgi:hypothetical protein
VANFNIFQASGGITTNGVTGANAALGQEIFTTRRIVAKAIHIRRHNASSPPISTTVSGAIYLATSSTVGTLVTGSTVSITYDLTAGWKTGTITTPVILNANQRYKVVVIAPTGHGKLAAYWTVGGGSAGFPNPVGSAPYGVLSSADSLAGAQCTFTTVGSAGGWQSALTYPITSAAGDSYWLDVTVAELLSGTATLASTSDQPSPAAVRLARPSAALASTSTATVAAQRVVAVTAALATSSTVVAPATLLSPAVKLASTSDFTADVPLLIAYPFATLAANSGVLAPIHNVAHARSRQSAVSGLKATIRLIGQTELWTPVSDVYSTAHVSTPARFIAQSIDGTWLSWDLPLSAPTIKQTLSGPSVISGKLEPESAEIAELGLKPWGTWIHCEVDGEIRASGLLQPGSLDDETLTITAEGSSTYPHGMPYLGSYLQYGVEVSDIVREIWSHLQSYPDGNLGVTVSGTVGVKVGTPKTESDPESGPYQLFWYDETDCGDEINKLAQSSPFEYIERDKWNADRTAITHTIEIAPTLGRRRDDLRFAQGENILDQPRLPANDDFANFIVGAGAGEGTKKVHAYSSITIPGQLRRCSVLTDNTVILNDRMKSLCDTELRRRSQEIRFDQVTVSARSDNALFGAYIPGDYILIEYTLPYLGLVKLWHQVTAIEYSPDDETVAIDLARMDPV